MNHLEQLAAEWYEFQGYFVRRNVHVGKLPGGGWECELDVVAFHPKRAHLVHIEPSMDTDSWAKRETRYRKKFEAGRKHIPMLFEGVAVPGSIEQVALFGLGSRKNNPTLAGGRVMLISDLLLEITGLLLERSVTNQAVPEQFPLLRTIQFVCEHQRALFSEPRPNSRVRLLGVAVESPHVNVSRADGPDCEGPTGRSSGLQPGPLERPSWPPAR